MRKRNANLSNLLQDTPEAYYWIGFLIADGSFSNNNRLSLGISSKDEIAMKKFCSFVDGKYYIEKEGTIVRFACMDTAIVATLKEKFGIKTNKTYNPPLLSIPNDTLFLSFFIGFIDGDGCIQNVYKRQDTAIIIKLHKTWINVLQTISARLYSICDIKQYPIVKLNTAGYARMNITNGQVVHFLKTKALTFKLPVLLRKWDKIDLNYESRTMKSKRLKPQILILYKQGIKQQSIAQQLQVSKAWVSLVVRGLR
jgi:hypothetical protein